MPLEAIIFMAITWTGVISLVIFCYSKMLKSKKPGDDIPSDPVK